MYSASTTARSTCAAIQAVWPPPSCLPPFRQYRKVNGSWTVVATIGGERCDDHVADVDDGRALVVREPIVRSDHAAAGSVVYADTGAASWPQVASFASAPAQHRVREHFRPRRQRYAAISRTSTSGTSIRDLGNNNWVSAGKMVEPEVELSIILRMAAPCAAAIYS